MLSAVQDGDWLHAHVSAMTDKMESGRPAPWAVNDAPADYIASLQRGIVGLRLPVTRLTGAWKVNQHKSQADRAGTVQGLAASGPMGLVLAQVLQPKD
jgi:transcriptional regulator